MLLLDSYAVAINYIEKETIQKNEIQPGFESVSTSIEVMHKAWFNACALRVAILSGLSGSQ